MIEEFGDIWEIPGDARVITTNGVVRKDGACVMGRGVALQAKMRYPGSSSRSARRSESTAIMFTVLFRRKAMLSIRSPSNISGQNQPTLL